MSSRPEDLPKVIVLCVSVVALVLYLVFVEIPKMTATHIAPPRPAPPVVSAPGNAAQNAANPGQNPANSATNPGNTSQSAANPGQSALVQFTAATAVPTPPVMAPSAPVDLYADVDEPDRNISDPFSPPVPDPSAMPLLPDKPATLPGMVGGAGTPSVLPHTPPPPWPDITLQGVVPGEPAIAVVHVDGQTYYKSEGDLLQGGVRLVKISEAGIILQRDQKNVTLEVGHSTQVAQNAPHTAVGSAPASPDHMDAAALPLTDGTEQATLPPSPAGRPVAQPLARGKPHAQLVQALSPVNPKPPVATTSYDVVDEPILHPTETRMHVDLLPSRIGIVHRRPIKRWRVRPSRFRHMLRKRVRRR